MHPRLVLLIKEGHKQARRDGRPVETVLVDSNSRRSAGVTVISFPDGRFKFRLRDEEAVQTLATLGVDVKKALSEGLASLGDLDLTGEPAPPIAAPAFYALLETLPPEAEFFE